MTENMRQILLQSGTITAEMAANDTLTDADITAYQIGLSAEKMERSGVQPTTVPYTSAPSTSRIR